MSSDGNQTFQGLIVSIFVEYRQKYPKIVDSVMFILIVGLFFLMYIKFDPLKRIFDKIDVNVTVLKNEEVVNLPEATKLYIGNTECEREKYSNEFVCKELQKDNNYSYRLMSDDTFIEGGTWCISSEAYTIHTSWVPVEIKNFTSALNNKNSSEAHSLEGSFILYDKIDEKNYLPKNFNELNISICGMNAKVESVNGNIYFKVPFNIDYYYGDGCQEGLVFDIHNGKKSKDVLPKRYYFTQGDYTWLSPENNTSIQLSEKKILFLSKKKNGILLLQDSKKDFFLKIKAMFKVDKIAFTFNVDRQKIVIDENKVNIDGRETYIEQSLNNMKNSEINIHFKRQDKKLFISILDNNQNLMSQPNFVEFKDLDHVIKQLSMSYYTPENLSKKKEVLELYDIVICPKEEDCVN